MQKPLQKLAPIALGYMLLGSLLGVNSQYFTDPPGEFVDLVTMGLALALWPLIWLGIDLHVTGL